MSLFGLSLVVLLFAAVLFVLLAMLRERAISRRARCEIKLHNFCVATRGYVIEQNDCLPPAWHVAGEPRADLANVSYHRFLIHEYLKTGFRHIVGTARPGQSSAGKFQQTRKVWEDPATGATCDYFAPLLVFTGHRDAKGNLDPTNTETFSKHTQFAELAATGVGSTDRPMLAGVDASYANAEGKGKTPDHQAELRRGWQTVQCLGSEVFLGVGPSLREPGDLSSSRFDFRHGGLVNVVFLDGHGESIEEANTDRLRRIYAAWDKLKPFDE